MAYLYWFIALALFSSLEVVSKPIMGLVDPFFTTFFRFFVGGIFLFILSKKNIRGKDLLHIILIGCLNCIISMTMLQLSIKLGNASSAATLISTSPMFTAFFVTLMVKEKISARKKTGIALGFFGIMVFGFGMLEGDSITGILLGIGAAMSFAMYSVLLRKYVLKYGPVNCTAYSALFPSVIYGIGLLVTGNMRIPSLDIQGWLILLYLGVFVTGIAYFALLEAVKRMGSANAMRLFYLKPVVATTLAVAFLSESIGIVKLSGMGIIIFSLFF